LVRRAIAREIQRHPERTPPRVASLLAGGAGRQPFGWYSAARQGDAKAGLLPGALWASP